MLEKVTFYLLKPQAADNRYTLACRLAEKAWQQQHRIHIHTHSEQEAVHLDQLLWTFRQSSFVPHGLIGQIDPEHTPILLGWQQEKDERADVLLNLAQEIPAFFRDFTRVIELIDQDPAMRQAARERYRQYRDQGYVLETHEIG